MNIEDLRSICLDFPGVTEDIKWGNNLTFLVAGKLFCLTDLDSAFGAALKVPTEDFDELIAQRGIGQASHFARRQWVFISDENELSNREWLRLIKQSYDLVVAKLPKREREKLGVG
jgi:predicted DNA-binding protein (MmcQ/YjbR family)